jgi:hypothetical protein
MEINAFNMADGGDACDGIPTWAAVFDDSVVVATHIPTARLRG